MKKWILICVAALALSGCAQGVAGISAKIQTNADFNELVLEDVQQAIIMAERTNDALALMCWNYLEAFTLENAPAAENLAGKVVGAFSAYQQARNVRRTVIEVEISDQFRVECGPMLTDTMGALGRLGVRISL